MRRDHAEREGELDEAGALPVLRKVLDLELFEQRAEVRLDRVDRDDELVGDLVIGCRQFMLLSVLERPAEGDEDAALSGDRAGIGREETAGRVSSLVGDRGA